MTAQHNANRQANQEAINNRAKRMYHRLIARLISVDPSVVEEAKKRLSTGPDALSANDEWRQILNLPVLEIRRAITSNSPKMERLRLSSPFRAPFLQDIDVRRRIQKLARKRFRTSTSD